jgi:glycogen operon protein
MYSCNASSVELLLFHYEDDVQPEVIALDPSSNRTFHYWHSFVPGLQPGQLYGYRVHGASNPSDGMRFDSSKVLLDPYGREVVMPKPSGQLRW